MKQTSEFVSLGHPDKIADFVSSYLLDRDLERDPFTRYAVECQIKDSMVTLGGEVTSSYAMPLSEVRVHVADAVRSARLSRRPALRTATRRSSPTRKAKSAPCMASGFGSRIWRTGAMGRRLARLLLPTMATMTFRIDLNLAGSVPA